MKTKVELSIGLLSFLVFLGILLGLVLSLSGLLIASIEAANGDYFSALVSGLGNVIGGIIGVLAAFLIAAYQIKKTFELERNKGEASNSAVLRLLKTELKSNKKIIENFKDKYFEGSRDFLELISVDNWDRCSLQIGIETSDETLNNVSSVYRKIKLLKTEQKMDASTYDRLKSDLSIALDSIEGDLTKLR